MYIYIDRYIKIQVKHAKMHIFQVYKFADLTVSKHTKTKINYFEVKSYLAQYYKITQKITLYLIHQLNKMTYRKTNYKIYTVL